MGLLLRRNRKPCPQSLGGNSLLGEAHLVLCKDVFRVVLPVQVLGVEKNFKACLGQIPPSGQIQVVVVAPSFATTASSPAGTGVGCVLELLPFVFSRRSKMLPRTNVKMAVITEPITMAMMMFTICTIVSSPM